MFCYCVCAAQTRNRLYPIPLPLIVQLVADLVPTFAHPSIVSIVLLVGLLHRLGGASRRVSRCSLVAPLHCDPTSDKD